MTVSNGYKDVTVTMYKEVYHAVQDYIKARVEADNLLLNDFCADSNYGRRTVQRALAWHGTSWRRVLARVRMQEAARLLRVTSESVNAVARKVGYSQPSQFAKAFKAHTGMAPTHYRDSTRGGGVRV